MKPTLPKNGVAILGIPSDESSSYMRGPLLGPQRIRETMHCGSANMTTEQGHDLGTDPRWQHVGDLTLTNGAEARDQITNGVANLLAQDVRVLSLGGDHAVTYPIMRAYAEKYPDLTIVQFDAHPDLYDELDGNRYAHACPFARIMEAGLAKRLVQIGIRTMNRHQREQAERFGVEVIEPWNLATMQLELEGAVYVSLDLDVLDPAYAPGVSHHEPGGLTSRELFQLIQMLPTNNLVGADVVELNPHRDLVNMTAMVGAKCVKELLAHMLDSPT